MTAAPKSMSLLATWAMSRALVWGGVVQVRTCMREWVCRRCSASSRSSSRTCHTTQSRPQPQHSATRHCTGPVSELVVTSRARTMVSFLRRFSRATSCLRAKARYDALVDSSTR